MTTPPSEPEVPPLRLANLLRVRPVILDTSVLTSDIIAAERRGRTSGLVEAMTTGVVRGFVTHRVWAEVPRVLARRAEKDRLDWAALESSWWTTYVPLIRVVDTTGLPETAASRQLAGRDETDVPTLLLAGVLAPVALLAADRDLRDSGLAIEDWAGVRAAAGSVARVYSGAMVGANVTTAVASGAWGLGRQLVRQLRNPYVVVALLITILTGARLRSRWQSVAQAQLPKARALADGLLDAAMQIYMSAAQIYQKADRVWTSAELGIVGDELLHRLARVLAAAQEPLTRTMVVQTLWVDEPGNHRTRMAALLELLERHAMFVEVRNGRWQLGRDGVDFGELGLAGVDEDD
jgi:predicted nucleic acid-binding protein